MKTQTRVKSRRSSKSKKNRELRKELGKKLLGYSVAAGAVLTIGAGVAEADAIKVTNQIDIFPNNFFVLDINSDGLNDLSFSIINTSLNSAYVFGANPGVSIAGFSGLYANYASNLATNAPINTTLFGSSLSYALLAYYSNYYGAPFTTGTGSFLSPNNRGFLGVRFDIPGGSPHFGWVDVEVIDIANQVNQLRIHAYGWETVSNKAISAGAGEEQPIPEPATLLTLAMGVAGIYAWRRNRKRKSVKNTTQNETQNV